MAALRKGGTLRSLPAWVEELTRNRHHGVDLVLATQDPPNADSFIRRLVNKHEHYVNKFGAPSSIVYTWAECCEDVDQRGARERADKRTYKYPAELFGSYTSAILHTREKYTPRRVKMAYVSGAIFLALPVLIGWRVSGFWHHAEPAKTASSSAAPVKREESSSFGGGLFASAGGGERPKRHMAKAEWLQQQELRIPGVAWSEPLFDEHKAEAKPEVYCMSVLETHDCKCISEQGTEVMMPVVQCRTIARYGLYNPFRRPIEDRITGRTDRPEQRAQPERSRPEIVEAEETAATVTHTGAQHHGPRHKPISADYDPSEFRERSTQYLVWKLDRPWMAAVMAVRTARRIVSRFTRRIIPTG